MGHLAPRSDDGERRLAPTMRSRKLQALDFIKGYFAQWGESPSLSELAAALGVSTKRASILVHQLAREEMIRHVAGKARGIRLIEAKEQLGEAELLVRLAEAGWLVDRTARTVTNRGLPPLPLLHHDPPQDRPDPLPASGGSGAAPTGAGNDDGDADRGRAPGPAGPRQGGQG